MATLEINDLHVTVAGDGDGASPARSSAAST